MTRRESVTLFMLLNAAYAMLLGRYSRQKDVVIGFPVANRPRKELESMVGFFVNMLPLRVDLSGNPGIIRTASTRAPAFSGCIQSPGSTF